MFHAQQILCSLCGQRFCSDPVYVEHAKVCKSLSFSRLL
jgi:hypothetical protein